MCDRQAAQGTETEGRRMQDRMNKDDKLDMARNGERTCAEWSSEQQAFSKSNYQQEK